LAIRSDEKIIILAEMFHKTKQVMPRLLTLIMWQWSKDPKEGCWEKIWIRWNLFSQDRHITLVFLNTVIWQWSTDHITHQDKKTKGSGLNGSSILYFQNNFIQETDFSTCHIITENHVRNVIQNVVDICAEIVTDATPYITSYATSINITIIPQNTWYNWLKTAYNHSLSQKFLCGGINFPTVLCFQKLSAYSTLCP
jgi:hypothetical protein